jgi:hypothetical protein
LAVQSYGKTSEKQKKLVSFFFRVAVTSRCKRKVTEKRGKCKRKACFSFLYLGLFPQINVDNHFLLSQILYSVG